MERIQGYGVIGCGWVMPSHAVGARSLSDAGVRLVAMADVDGERARQAAADFEAEAWYTDHRALLARDDIAFVSVCLPHHLHRTVVVDALRAGKHVLCEKPLAMDVGEADEMIAEARSAGRHLGVIFQHRYDPPFRRLHAAAQAGGFGRVLTAQVFHKSTSRGSPVHQSAWRDAWSTVGGGVMLVQGLHFLDIALWCVGPVESAGGSIATLARPEEVEDTGSAVLRFRNGALGSFVSTNASESPRLTRLEIHGTAGAAVVQNGQMMAWHPAADYVERQLDEAEAPVAPRDRERLNFGLGHVLQIRDFVTRIQSGQEPSVTAEDGRHATAVMQAIYESARTGRFVQVP